MSIMITACNAPKRNKISFQQQVGQSMVEFALILPLIVLVIAGIFDLGRAFFSSITITNAAREGARTGTVNHGFDFKQGMCDATTAEAVSSGIVITNDNVTISCISTQSCTNTISPGCNHNNPLTVTVTYTYTDMLLLGFFFPGGIEMQRSVEMLVP